MITAKPLWTPYPYKAGFCVTDDTDAATLTQVKTVYDHLLSINFVTTKTVWPFNPSEPSGLPALPASILEGITLQDQQYLDYCKMLHENGFEISLHGASSGNNGSAATRAAFDMLDTEIGRSDTFICHAKNAENIYWNYRVTSLFPFRQLLKLLSSHECYGEDAASPYYWGDICKERINQIRLFRTRALNTLKKNPHMPYYSPEKPLVNGWFSATKRSFHDCTSAEAQQKLVAENGLTVLYQYMHRYATKDGRLDENFKKNAESLAANPDIKIDTVSNTMQRLRLMQGIFILHEAGTILIVNTNAVPIDSFQLALNKPASVTSTDCDVTIDGSIVHLQNIPANAIVRLQTDNTVRVNGQRCFSIRRRKHIRVKWGLAQLFINLSGSAWQVAGQSIPPGAFLLQAPLSGTGLPQLSRTPWYEEVTLLFEQAWIIFHEILFKGRSIRRSRFLDKSTKEILLENHDIW
jgi:hypothetical protein